MSVFHIIQDVVYENKFVFYIFFGFFIGFIALRQYLYGTRYTGTARLDDKTVIITGASSGIGKEVAKNLAKRGAKVILACRDLAKTNKVVDEIKRQIRDTKIVVKHLDLASLQSIRKFAKDIKQNEERLDILINNAGVFYCPDGFRTDDGFEMQFGVNHLGHFLLTNLLLGLLKKSAPSRVVTVSSNAHEKGRINFDDINSEKKYEPRACYDQSKLANVLFSRELSKRLRGSGVTTYSLHPGVVRTNISKYVRQQRVFSRPLIDLYLVLPLFKDSEQGTSTIIYCAVDESLTKESGNYYRECSETIPGKQALDDGVSKKLWELSEKMVGLT
ncbi:retinol dehydrogenase 14-like [Mytilus californianus]|uniref:retinol dehydrogenase 14-like n=1 Tax=Mytilus californianus TaxID=6549 RepID=UPI0022456127|nr:retinol dehydrogenase 14-like [Mytilus californianus]